jgi:hypothetical protein
LRTKAALIEAVVEGVAEPPLEGDLLGALETLVGALSPKLATLGDSESGEDAVDRLLREAVAAARAQPGPTAGGPEREALRRLPAEAILALARVLSGPVTTRYRVDSSSTAGAYYMLDVDGGDVSCTCRGFEYRGACRHARGLKAALARGGPVPAEYRAL